jgi:hypothetical protein
MKLNKYFMLVLFLSALTFTVNAQSQSEAFYNATYGTSYASDTVTNTGTAVLLSPVISGGGTSVAIVVKVIEISGTTGGTFLLEGCNTCDGNDWATVNLAGTATSSGSHTISDVASKAYSWWFHGSPFRRYRITHTGTGTMSARDFATIVKK